MSGAVPAEAPTGRGSGLLRGSRAGIVLAILTPLLFLLTLGTWSLASPAGSSPDDDFHLASIWCAQGDRPGLCAPGTSSASRQVPSGLIKTPFCFVFKSDQSAQCQGVASNDLRATSPITTERGNFAGLYPPVFYATLSVFAGNDLDNSVLLMRWFNAALYVGLLTAVVLAVPRRLRRPAIVGAVVTAVPLGMFIIPSTNPSSWAMLCAATLWVSLLGFLESRGRRAWVLAALSVLAVVIGAGARADAAVFAVFAVALVAVLWLGRDRITVARIAVPVGVTVLAGLLYLTASQGNQLDGGMANDARSTLGPLHLFLLNMTEVPRFWVSMLGEWGLGWLDTPMPAAVWALGGAAFFGLIFWGLGMAGVRKSVAFVAAFLALWAVPALMLTASGAVVGEVVQPRYILPLGVIAAGIAVLSVPRRPRLRLSGLQAVSVLVALSIANSLALRATMRRFITGNDVGGWNLNLHIEWWWSHLPSPELTWMVGSVAFAAALGGLVLLDRRDRLVVEDVRPGAPDAGTLDEPRTSAAPAEDDRFESAAASTADLRPEPAVAAGGVGLKSQGATPPPHRLSPAEQAAPES